MLDKTVLAHFLRNFYQFSTEKYQISLNFKNLTYNLRFQAVRHVKFEDKMDIFCPEVSTNQNPETVSSSHHYQTIHLVDKDAYDTCTLNGSEQYVS